jgi:hypothetical protein
MWGVAGVGIRRLVLSAWPVTTGVDAGAGLCCGLALLACGLLVLLWAAVGNGQGQTPAGPYLDDTTAWQILFVAIEPDRRRLCSKNEATHACAAAAAGMLAKGVARLVESVRNDVKKRLQEMVKEEVFDRETLVTQLWFMQRTVAHLSGLAGQLTTQYYCCLPGTGPVYRRLIRIKRYLKKYVVDRLVSLRDELDGLAEDGAAAQQTAQQKIRRVIKGEMPKRLALALVHPEFGLQPAEKEAQDIYDKLRDHWLRDVRAIDRYPHCRP